MMSNLNDHGGRSNPRRFDFDNIGHAMLALFETLSFKGWTDIRDVLAKTIAPVMLYFTNKMDMNRMKTTYS